MDLAVWGLTLGASGYGSGAGLRLARRALLFPPLQKALLSTSSASMVSVSLDARQLLHLVLDNRKAIAILCEIFE